MIPPGVLPSKGALKKSIAFREFAQICAQYIVFGFMNICLCLLTYKLYLSQVAVATSAHSADNMIRQRRGRCRGVVDLDICLLVDMGTLSHITTKSRQSNQDTQAFLFTDYLLA